MFLIALCLLSAVVGNAGISQQPVFKPVYEHGENGYPEYRIPSLVTTKKGTLLAFCEGRRTLSNHAENGIVLKRSTDDGQTWSKPRDVTKGTKRGVPIILTAT